jgi:hypothetical protein
MDLGQVLMALPIEGICRRSGKRRYRTRKLAAQALVLSRRLPGWVPDQGSVYRCAMCRSWHLTHLPPSPGGAPVR